MLSVKINLFLSGNGLGVSTHVSAHEWLKHHAKIRIYASHLMISLLATEFSTISFNLTMSRKDVSQQTKLSIPVSSNETSLSSSSSSDIDPDKIIWRSKGNLLFPFLPQGLEIVEFRMRGMVTDAYFTQ